LEVYEDILRRGDQAEETIPRKSLAQAYFNKVVTLRQLNRRDEALNAATAMLDTFERNSDDTTKIEVARANLLKSVLLDEQGKAKEALNNLDNLTASLRDTKDIGLEQMLASALLSRTKILADEKEIEQAISASEMLLHQFGNRDESQFGQYIVAAKKFLESLKSLSGKHPNEPSDTSSAT
jgi:tetratricopeptide (TPR) repeat protein